VRQSAYNLVTELGDGRVLLTNLLSRSVLAVSNAQRILMEQLTGEMDLAGFDELQREFIATLAQTLFILPDDFDELAHVRRMHQDARADVGVKNLVIAPTMQCNMSCHYCFENRTGPSMCPSVQDALFRHVSVGLAAYDSLHVQWFGGEPLLNLEMIETLSARFSDETVRQGKDYSAEIITNGVLLSEDAARRLAAVNVREAQITLEGMQTFHDKVRFTNEHGKSFDKILQNVASASPHLNINVRVHVAPYNLDSVHELIDHLGTSVAKSITRLYFSPLFNYQAEGKLAQYLIDRRKFMGAREFAEVQIELIRRANSYGIETGDPLKASYGLCLAMLHGTDVVGPTGALTNCYLDINVESKAHTNLIDGRFSPELKAVWTD